MSKIFDKVLSFVGWEVEDEEEIMSTEERNEEPEEKSYRSQLLHGSTKKQSQHSKVVNLHASNQMKVVVMQPDNFDEAQDICDHLKEKKPIVVNLESVEKEVARRIVDFLSGSVYALDGSIQKVSNNIFVIAPSNIDIMGDYKDEFKGKGVFPWAK